MISKKTAEELHENVPPDWYYRSIKENILQRYWHKRRFEEVQKLIDKVDGKVLDIGSADGVFSRVILRNTKAKKLIGIDVLKSSVDWANKHWKKNNKMNFKVGNAHDLEFKNSEFDAVFALEVIEHVHDPETVLKQIKRVLKKSGYVLLLVPSENILFKVIWFLWGFYRGKIWKGAHLHEFSGNHLVKLGEKAGLITEINNRFLLGMLHVVKFRKE
ncbi:class I SAM-dependent methyltransferase [Candidatus Woesebacteria bacterium]|nr:class I SAM-dependent methyltransferase [Candidatus Woesebacteria bacterium]